MSNPNPDFGYAGRKNRHLSLTGRGLLHDLGEGTASAGSAKGSGVVASTSQQQLSEQRERASTRRSLALRPESLGRSKADGDGGGSGGGGGKADEAVAPEPSRMEWLYRMVSAVHTTDSYAYSDDSREWLSDRVDAADGDVKENETEEEARWWADTSGVPPSMSGAAAAPPSPSPAPAKEPAAAAAAEPALPVLSLEQVLNSPALRSDLRAYLEENFAAEGLSFLEALQQWSETDPVAFPRRFVKQAQALHALHVDLSADDVVNVPNELRVDVRTACKGAGTAKQLPERSIRAMREAFGAVREAVIENLREDAFARFLRSDEYREMLSVRFDQDSAESGASSAALRTRAWQNDKGYRAIRVRLKSVVGLSTGRKAWCHVGVDSRTYGTAAASAGCTHDGVTLHTFGEDFEYPVTGTTQQVRLTVWSTGLLGGGGGASAGQFEGRAFVPIADVQGNEGAEVRVKLLPREHSQHVTGEAVVEFQLLTEEAAERRDGLVREDDTSAVADGIRGLVSKKKKRFKGDGFDLDLTYVTERIIAMGYPSEGVEGVYRNNMEDVQRFFEQRHPRCYRLYNLCAERHYDPAKFKGRVARYPFDDHNPPSMETLKAFCRDVHAWLAEHPQNVAAIHCKAGKGRTGTVIGALFVHENMVGSAQEGLKIFARERTKNQKGVTIPSQMRYVHYYDIYCRLRRLGLRAPPKASLFLQAIQLNYLPPSLESGDVWFTITQNNHKGLKYKSKGKVKVDRHKVKKAITLDFGAKPFLLTEDARVEFYHATRFGKEKLFQCWFNTRYTTAIALKQHAGDLELGRVRTERVSVYQQQVDMAKNLDSSAVGNVSVVEQPYGHNYIRLVFSKWHLDKACKDKKNKSYPANFNVEFLFRQQERHREAVEAAVAEQWAALPFDVGTSVTEDEQKIVEEVGGEGEEEEEEEEQEEQAERGGVMDKESETAAPAATNAAAANTDADNDDDGEEVLKVGNLLSVKLK